MKLRHHITRIKVADHVERSRPVPPDIMRLYELGYTRTQAHQLLRRLKRRKARDLLDDLRGKLRTQVFEIPIDMTGYPSSCTVVINPRPGEICEGLT